jgi:hypothetical protein
MNYPTTVNAESFGSCPECGAHRLQPFVAGVTQVIPGREYLVYNEPNDEWDIAQWDPAEGWGTTVREIAAGMYPVTHYMELPRQ